MSGSRAPRCYTPRRHGQAPRDRGIARQGADDRALPRRGLPGPRVVRPRPRPAREPGQGQVRRRRRSRLRARVRHPRGPPQAGLGDREGGRAARTTSTSPPTSTARARRSRGTSPRPPTSRRARRRRVTFSEITEGAIRDAFANPRDIDQDLVDAQQTRRIVDRLVGYTLSPLLSRKVRGGLSAGRVQSVAVRHGRRARAGDPRVHGPRVLDARGAARDGRRRHLHRGPRPDRRQDASTSATARPPSATPRPSALLRPVVESIATRQSKRNPAPPFTTSTLQQEASRKLGFSPKRTMSVAQRLYEGVDTPDGHVGLITYMRTDSTAIAAVAMAEAQEVIADALRRAVRHRQGPRLQDEGEGRPGGPRVDPADLVPCATRTRCARTSRPRSCGSTASSGSARSPRRWRPRSSRPRPPSWSRTTTACAPRRPGRCSTASPRVYTEGQDDAAAEEAERHAPAARRGRRDLGPVGHADPALHRAPAALHRGDADQGARGARHRPPVDVRRDHLHDRRPRLRPGRGAPPPPRGDRGDRHRPAGRRTSASTWTSRSRPAMEDELDEVARGEREWVPLLREFYAPLKDARRREAQGAQARRLHDRGDRRGVLRGPPDGDPPRAQREVPRLLALPGAQGDAAAARATEAPDARGRRRACPQCGEGTLATKRGRFGAFVGCSRYPDCTYIHKDGPPPPDQLPFEVTCPKNADGHLDRASRPAHRERLLGVLPLPEVRLHDQRPADGRGPRRSTPMARARSCARARPGCA